MRIMYVAGYNHIATKLEKRKRVISSNYSLKIGC